MDSRIVEFCKKQSIEPAALLAFVSVETGGIGFDPKTGKVLIQFEPAWFRKKAPYAPSGLWSLNKVDVQSKEWLAFNNAFSKDPNAAMLSTSIGIGQIMGFQYKVLGYKTVGEMWDDAKKSIESQLTQMVKFIESDKALKKALISHDWTTAAIHYNGAGFRDIAKKYKRDPYDISLKKAYEKYKSIV